jgi:hypothetical protein
MTSIVWFIDQLSKVIYNPLETDGYTKAIEKVYAQAIEMHRQQIIDAYQSGDGDAYNLDATKEWGEEYYNETYGSKGSDEVETPKINTWDDIFDNIESKMDCIVPLKVVNYLEKHYMKPTQLQTDENGKPLTYWGGLDFTKPNANNIKSGSTQTTSSQTEISDEEIEKGAWENQCLSRQDVYELFDEVFKDKTLEGMFKISASKEVRQFKEKLRQLAKEKYREQLVNL